MVSSCTATNWSLPPPCGFLTDLVGLVEEQAEVGEHHPQLLPAVTVLELPQEVTRQLVLQQWDKRAGEAGESLVNRNSDCVCGWQLLGNSFNRRVIICSQLFDCGFLFKLQQLISWLCFYSITVWIIVDIHFIFFSLITESMFRDRFSKINTIKIIKCPLLHCGLWVTLVPGSCADNLWETGSGFGTSKHAWWCLAFDPGRGDSGEGVLVRRPASRKLREGEETTGSGGGGKQERVQTVLAC